MDDGRFKLNRPVMLSVPLRDAELLIEDGDGDGALLYLYLLKSGGALDEERAARDLRLSVQKVRQTAKRLEHVGIFSASAGPREEPAAEYRAEDVVRRSQSDPDFKNVVAEAERTLGRVLSSADVKSLFWIYDELALPPGVIMLLLHRCREDNDERYGAERALGMAAVKKTAQQWCDRELVTVELAEEYLAEQDRRKGLADQVRRAIGIRDRALSPTERRYVNDWIGLGFGPEELALAADKTVTNTGGLKWRYMNSIVRSWHEKGLHTLDEIRQKDRKSGSAKSAPSGTMDQQELEQMRQVRERMRREKEKR